MVQFNYYDEIVLTGQYECESSTLLYSRSILRVCKCRVNLARIDWIATHPESRLDRSVPSSR